jgi:membrane-associated phospholipid phosphatase
VAVAALVGLLLLTLVLAEHEDFPGDRLLLPTGFAHWVPASLRTLADVFSFLAEPLVALLSVASLATIVAIRIGRRDGLLSIVIAGALIINEAARRVIGPTPAEIAQGGRPEANFPSGHTVYAGAVFGFAAWLALVHGRRRLCAACCIVMVAMGPLRVLKGSHWPSDVVAGYALGFAWLITVLTLGLPWAADGRPTGPAAAPRRYDPGP